tara:strand:- start:321 stop:584 length:264 start_codon:yes stop_codon:yes gene_type:complete
MTAEPLYKTNQRVQERKKSNLGVSRTFTDKKLDAFYKYKNERKFTIVGEPKLKADSLKRKSWLYPIVEDGKKRIEWKIQGMLKPVEE